MGRRRNAPRRGGGSDDEDDEEYVLGEEDDGESFDEFPVSDATEDEFQFGDSSCGSDEEREIVYDDEEEEEDYRGEVDDVKAAAVALEEEKVEAAGLMLRNRRAKKSRVSVVREDNEKKREEEGVRSRRRKAVILDYAEEEDEEDDERDEDFLPSDGEDNDVDEEEISGETKRREKKRKPKAVRQNLKKRMRRGRSGDDDEDFAVESEPSDSDFSCSDDDFIVKNPVAPYQRSNEIKNAQRRRRLLVVPDVPDSDCFLMEGELRTLDKGAIDPPQSRMIMRQQDQEKGKEKKGDDFGKQSCGICLSEEQKRTVQGKLDCCAHFFCFSCIMEWSKVETRCPVCKRRFSTITKTSQLDTEFGMKKVVNVQIRDQVYQPSAAEIRQMLDPYRNVVCVECQQDVDDSLMLLCDICDSCAHTYCVGLGREVPEGNWYCDSCRSATTGSLCLQNQGTLADGVHGCEDLAHGIQTEDSVAHIHANTYSHQSGSSPHLVALQRFDLNAPPVSDDIYGAMSPATGAGAATLSGRRAIHQRIRIMLSNSRPQHMLSQSNVLDEKVETVVQEVEQSGRSLFRHE